MLAALGCAAAARAQDSAPLGGYVTLGSGYWSRGFSQNDGATLQVGLDYEHHGGFFAGGRAMNVDYAVDYSYERPREIEVGVYAGFHRRREAWSWTVTLARYLYPDAAGSYDYDDVSAAFGFRDRVFYTASYSSDFYGRSRSALNQEVMGVVPLHGDVELTAAVGRFTVRNGIEHTHWNAGVSKLVKRLAVDVRYYDGGYGRRSVLGDTEASHFVVTLSYALRARRIKT
jgi:uncharacterized protein (TIGR02001 family)